MFLIVMKHENAYYSFFDFIRQIELIFTLCSEVVPKVVHSLVDLLGGPEDIFSTRIQLFGSLDGGEGLSAYVLALVQDLLHLLVLASLLVEEQLFQSLAWFRGSHSDAGIDEGLARLQASASVTVSEAGHRLNLD